MDKITIEKQTCTRCGTKFWPKVNADTDEIILPKNCRNEKCNSPYWNTKKKRFY